MLRLGLDPGQMSAIFFGWGRNTVSGGGQIPEMSALCTEMDSCQLPSEWTRAVSLMPPPFSKHWHLESQVQFAVSQRDVVAAPTPTCQPSR